MSSAKISLDKEAFFRRAKKIYSAWKASSSDNGASFSEVDSIVVAVGNDDDVIYSKSTALHQWLFGYELTDTLLVLAESSLNILASKKKIDFLKPLQEAQKKHEGFPTINLHLRDKSDKDKTNIQKLIEVIKESKKGKNVGVFQKDNFHSEFIDSWYENFKKNSFEKVDISAHVAYVMAAKEDSELSQVKKAAHVSSDIFSKFFKSHIMEIVDQEKRVKHSKIADNLEAALDSEKYLLAGMDLDQTEMCFSPIIQSGENFSLRFSATSNDDRLDYGVIICLFGVRYRYYCSSIIRTMLVQPTEEQQANYNVLLSTMDAVVEKLKDGVKLSEVYNAALNHVKKTKPELQGNLVKSIGFATGIEFREESLTINAKSNYKAQKGMIFCVSVGFSGLVKKGEDSKKDKQYALFIGDTVLVNENSAATLLTPAKKKINNIGIFLKDENEQEDSDNEDSKTTGAVKEDVNEIKKDISEIKKDVNEIREFVVQMFSKLTQLEETVQISCSNISIPVREDIIVIAGDTGTLGANYRSVERFSWKKKVWERIASLNRARYGASSLVFGDELYVGNFLPIEVLDFKNEPPEWRPVENQGFFKVDQATLVCGNRVVLIGGSHDLVIVNDPHDGHVDTISEVLLTPHFTSKVTGRMPEPRRYLAAELFEDKIFIFGGRSCQNYNSAVDSVLEFDLSNNKCRVLSWLPHPLSEMATVRWRDKVVLIGGRNKEGEVLNQVLMFSTAGKIERLPSLLEARARPCAVITGNMIVVMGGQGAKKERLSSVEGFVLGRYSWEYLPRLNEGRIGATAELVPAKFCKS